MIVISNHIKYNLNTLTTDNIRYVREFLAETLGTFALVLFGDGAVAQVKRLNVLLFFVVFTSSTNSIMFPGRSWQGGKERRFLRRFPQHMSGIWLRLDDWDLHQVGRSPVPQPTCFREWCAKSQLGNQTRWCQIPTYSAQMASQM